MKYINKQSMMKELRNTNTFIEMEEHYRNLVKKKSVLLQFLTKTKTKFINKLDIPIGCSIPFSGSINQLNKHGSSRELNILSTNHAETLDKMIEKNIFTNFDTFVISDKDISKDFILNEIKKMIEYFNYNGKYFVIARPSMLRKLKLDLCSMNEYKNQCSLIDNVYFIESVVLEDNCYYILNEDFQNFNYKIKPTIDLIRNEEYSKVNSLLWYSKIRFNTDCDYKNCLHIKIEK